MPKTGTTLEGKSSVDCNKTTQHREIGGERLGLRYQTHAKGRWGQAVKRAEGHT